MEQEKPKYKTWIRTKAIILFATLTIISFIGTLLTYCSVWFLLFIIPVFAFGYIFTIISVSAYRFSKTGNDYQNKIHKLIINYIDNVTPNNILDIGCGNGHLAIQTAKTYPNASVTGIDFWGHDWQYSKRQTEKNAEIEKVDTRTKFINGTASNLTFSDNSFENVISCLTFHEVKDINNKLVCVKEALRVLKPSGKFVFFDLFLDRGYYPTINEIKKELEQTGVSLIEMKKLDEYIYLPFPLRNKKVLGYGLMIIGTKNK
jgi:ubiquinone/menaquinone biosynthesis C-methylase UbiE